MLFWRASCLASILLCHGAIVAANPLLHGTSKSAPRQLHGKFLHITDLHPDGFYRRHSSTDEDDACHRGKGPAGLYGAEASDCDSPHSLVNATFDWLAASGLQREVDFVVWTGDSARHDSDEAIPRSAAEVLGSNRWLADKFAATFADADADGNGVGEAKSKKLAVPVVPTLGNNDILPHNILQPGPNRWLQSYASIWRRFVPEAQRHSFEFGGWFYVEVVPDRLAVFSLNTMYFFDRNAAVDGCASPSEPGYKQFEWLRVQLQFMRERGVKAILTGHVPPARTDSKQLWDESCWQKYTLWLQNYRDVIVTALYGHMNVDHFLLQDADEIELGTVQGGWVGPEGLLAPVHVREAMDDELTAASTRSYLQELREDWSKLPQPAALLDEEEDDEDEKEEGEVDKDKKRKHKNKDKERKLGGPWAERYQLSLVSPSIVPNYLPTIRVFEYNISGMEDAVVWVDPSVPVSALPRPVEEDEQQQRLELRTLSDSENGDESSAASNDNNDKKKGNRKHKKKKKPSLVVPAPPSKKSPPGPAYSPQPFTLMGYTQYFANLTRINLAADSSDGDDKDVKKKKKGKVTWTTWSWWRDIVYPQTEQPGFGFEVEYSTFDDKLYNLTDLTVRNFVNLAYRMGQKAGVKVQDEGDENRVKGEDSDDSDDSDDEDVRVDKKKGKGKKDRKKKDGEGVNKTWLHFLKHAFVGTVGEDELKKL